jgi:Cu+-exporting ATPase
VAAARNGIIIKTGARAFENASRITTVVVDKTGTLTLGRMAITAFKVHGAWQEQRWWQLIQTAEEGCEHWASEAIHKHMQPESSIRIARSGYIYRPGRGICCSADGTTVLVGNMEYLQEMDVEDIDLATMDSEGLEPTTNCVFIALNGNYAGYIAMKDQLHPEALPAITALKSLGLKVYMDGLTDCRTLQHANIAR